MEYTALSPKDIDSMLEALGLSAVEELFSHLPQELRQTRALDFPFLASEQDLTTHLRGLSDKNSGPHTHVSFLGGGAYDHFIPSVVKHLLGRSEFYSSYTPYQPELAQGTLQAMFEFQTLVCEITGMDVANASMYDGSTAVAEAALMASRIKKRQKVIVSSLLHPEYRKVLGTCLKEFPIAEIPFTEKGQTDTEALGALLDDETCAVIIQFPNFLGSTEDLDTIRGLCSENGAMFILACNEPFSLGVLKSPAEAGADIAVGEFQALGIPLSFGGPYVGYFASKREFVRQMPGRIVGETVDVGDRRGFVVTLATREQFIRREKATSNICTSQSLIALASTIYLSLIGKEGFKKIAVQNLSKAEYAKSKLSNVVELPFSTPTFNEFVIKCSNAESVLKGLLDKGFLGGISLERFYPELKDHVLIAVTERRTREEIDNFIDSLSEVLN